MLLTLKEKKIFVKNIKKEVNKSNNIFVANYNKLTATEMSILRKKTSNLKYVSLKVLSKKISNKIFLNSKHECLLRTLKGSIIIFYTHKDQKLISLLIYNFIKTYKKLNIIGISLNKILTPIAKLKILANLPDIKQLVLNIILIIKYMITKYLLIIQYPCNNLVKIFFYLKHK